MRVIYQMMTSQNYRLHLEINAISAQAATSLASLKAQLATYLLFKKNKIIYTYTHTVKISICCALSWIDVTAWTDIRNLLWLLVCSQLLFFEGKKMHLFIFFFYFNFAVKRIHNRANICISFALKPCMIFELWIEKPPVALNEQYNADIFGVSEIKVFCCKLWPIFLCVT